MEQATTHEGGTRPFHDDRALLLEALDLIERRRAQARHEAGPDAAPARARQDLLAAALAFERRWRASPDGLVLPALFRRLRLNRLERELVTSLALSALGLTGTFERPVIDIDDLLAFVPRTPRRRVRCLDATREDARLVREGVIEIEPGEVPWQTRLRLAPDIASSLVRNGKPARPEPPVKSQGDLLERLRHLVDVLWQRREGSIDGGGRPGARGAQRRSRSARLVETLDKQVLEACTANPGWALSHLLLSFTDVRERLVIVALVGHAAGYIPRDAEVDGDDLARAIASSREEIRVVLDFLHPEQRLRREGFIVVAEGGFDEEDPASRFAAARASFRLATRHVQALGLPPPPQTREAELRRPLVRLEQLALPAGLEEVLRVAVGQIKGAAILLDRWGLRQSIPYGRAVSLLFHGPPGVGKTAAAEALAHEAGKQILVVSLANVQQPYSGMTERALARAFLRAKESDAVLFLDECDALLYDRAIGRSGWEVRQVNVLLQELERFDGACVLATNRRTGLDAALERRIAFKLEFTPPDAPTRKRIWRCLVPPELPLAGDVDLDALADHALTGGQIKNVVLNAARFAVLRGEDARVTAADLDRAVRMEAPLGSATGRIGFAATGAA